MAEWEDPTPKLEAWYDQRVGELEKQVADTRVSVETAMKACLNERAARQAAEKRVEELERELNGELGFIGYKASSKVWEQRAQAAEAEVRRLEGLILEWRKMSYLGNDHEYQVAASNLQAEARRIREREGR